MCFGEIGGTVENNLKAKFVNESHSDYPQNALHMYAENQPTILRNHIILDDLPGKIYSVEAYERVFQIIARGPYKQKAHRNWWFSQILAVKNWCKSYVNSEYWYSRSTNKYQVGSKLYIWYCRIIPAKKLYVKFLGSQSSLKVMAKSYLSWQNSWVTIKKQKIP